MSRRTHRKNVLRLASLWGLACTLVSLWSPGTGWAQSRQLPVPFRDRPLVLPERTLRVDGDLSFRFRNDPAPNVVLLDLGGAGGVVRDLELGTILIPLEIAPDTNYRDPWFYALYRFQAGQVEFGIRGAITLPIDGDLALDVGPPLLVRLGPYGRLDTGFFLTTVFGDRTRFHGRIPLALAFQVTNELFLGPEMQISFPTFSDVHLMLGGFVGWSLAPHGLLADLVAHLRFWDINGGGNGVELLLATNFYFDI
jgi:hypothetical protein